MKNQGSDLLWRSRGQRGTLPFALIAGVIIMACFPFSVRLRAGARQPSSPADAPAQKQQTKLAASIGQWTAPANLCAPDKTCSVGIDAALLYTGKVLYYHYPVVKSSSTTSRATLLDPVAGTVTDVTLPFPWDIFCSALTIMQDGRVLVAGGDVKGAPNADSGEPWTAIFDPATETWTAGNNMNFARWYPSVIGLEDGTTIVFGGIDGTGTKVVVPIESYNPVTGVWTTLPSSANLPTATEPKYPRMSLLPDGNIVDSAPSSQTYQFNPSTNTWSFVANLNFGERYYAGHTLLPGPALEKILVVGGSATFNEGMGPGPATNTAEVIDFSQPTPAWSYIAPMTYARVNENLTLLADGTVLAVGGGGGNGKYANPVLTPELYNPGKGTWTALAPQAAQRTYHSTALLLPDGRVISAGSDSGSLQTTYEIFSPPYLFHGARPVITSAPTTLTYGAQFTISTPDAATITRVSLVRPGATTHADNFDQRYLDLAYTLGTGQITATAPDVKHAPPGYYMLVIVNSSGVPSVMPFLLLN